jgi:hypothetical protein
MPHIILRGHWCDITVLNVCAPTEDKDDDDDENFAVTFQHKGREGGRS